MTQVSDMVVEAIDDPGPAGLSGTAEVVVIGVRPAATSEEPPIVHPGDVAALADWGVDLPRRLVRARATGARGEITWIDLERDEPRAVLALGLGKGSPADLRRSGAAAARRLRGLGDVAVLVTRDLDESAIRAFVEGVHLASPTVTWASTPLPTPPRRVRFAVADPDSGGVAVALGREHGLASLAARRLVHTPANLLGPEELAAAAEELATECGLEVRTWLPEDLRRDGFGGLLAVGAGSQRGPRLVQVTRPATTLPDTPVRHVVLVGKGITFDSGGLSLKPPEMQIPMKTDMSGAAVVYAVMGALADRVPAGVQVTGLLCLAENMPGAGATRPGDVITAHGGVTTEVLNTDAEGRLVLGDGLDYAVADLGADVVVDVATLTGAATLGLGRRYAALFSNSDGLAGALGLAAAESGEDVWRMPLVADYAAQIASTVADHANSGREGRLSPGAITAALFLQRFVGDTPWAHLDIAGTGRSDAERDDLPKGGTGFGARLLLRWIEAGAPTSQ